jgi:hypothetical protein
MSERKYCKTETISEPNSQSSVKIINSDFKTQHLQIVSPLQEQRFHTSSSQSITTLHSNHPLVISITRLNNRKFNIFYSLAEKFPEEKNTSFVGTVNPYISYRSVHNLLSYGSPTDVSIIHSFLTYFWKSFPGSHAVDTNFHRYFMRLGWEKAFHKFFLHSHSSNYAKKTQMKPTLNSQSMLIPIRIIVCHWVALVWRVHDDRTYFLYSDDMNLANVADTVRSKYSIIHTSEMFHPP